MKHWNRIFGGTTLSLKHNYCVEEGRILRIIPEDGKFCVEEACDGYYNTTMTKQELKEALQEVMDWVDSFEETK